MTHRTADELVIAHKLEALQRLLRVAVGKARRRSGPAQRLTPGPVRHPLRKETQ